MQDGGLKIVEIGVDGPAERMRLDVAKKIRILGIETRMPKPNTDWYALRALLPLGPVVLTQRRRRAAAAI